MGQYSIHVEGHGIHDNGREDDADTMLRDFVERLGSAGHSIGSATFTVGATKELVHPAELGEGMPEHDADAPRHARAYRQASH
jgi:hypothetical protein